MARRVNRVMAAAKVKDRERSIRLADLWCLDVKPALGIWFGGCDCGKSWRYWDFGACLGAALEHQRRCRSMPDENLPKKPWPSWQTQRFTS